MSPTADAGIADELAEPAVVGLPGLGHDLSITDSVVLVLRRVLPGS